MHGGVKFYRGSAGAARSYVEADRSRVDDYYLAEGTGLAERYVATPTSEGVRPGGYGQEGVVRAAGMLDGPAYERWVAGYDVETGQAEGPAAQRRPAVCGSSRSWSTARRPGRWPRPCTRRSPPPTTQAQDRAAGRDHRLARRPRHHPGRAARPAGPGPGRAARGRRGAALHHPGRRPAPPPPPADQRPRLRRRRVARAALGRRRGQHRGDQRDRARRSHVRPRVPRGARRARVHPRPRDRRGRPARAVRRGVQRPRRADHPQHRPLRGPVAQRAPWRGARPDVAAGLGPSRVGSGPTRQGRTRERRRAPAAVGRGAAPARLHSPDCRGGAPCRPDRTGQPGRGGRPGALAAGGASVELERRRHPRRGRADHRRRRRRGTGAGTPRAGRGPDRPHRRPLRAAAGPRRRTRTRPRP